MAIQRDRTGERITVVSRHRGESGDPEVYTVEVVPGRSLGIAWEFKVVGAGKTYLEPNEDETVFTDPDGDEYVKV